TPQHVPLKAADAVRYRDGALDGARLRAIITARHLGTAAPRRERGRAPDGRRPALTATACWSGAVGGAWLRALARRGSISGASAPESERRRTPDDRRDLLHQRPPSPMEWCVGWGLASGNKRRGPPTGWCFGWGL